MIANARSSRTGRSRFCMTPFVKPQDHTTRMNELEATLASLTARSHGAVAPAPDARALDEVRVAFLGRSGAVTEVRKGIGKLPPAERPGAGKEINAAVGGAEAEPA